MNENLDRRSFVTALAAAGVAAGGIHEASARPRPRNFRRIATEEAFELPVCAEALAAIGRSSWDSLDLNLVHTLYNGKPTGILEDIRRRLLDVEQQERLQIMDRDGVSMHLLSLTSPGVQMFDTETAVRLATVANDYVAGMIQKHPGRFGGLASFAPQDPRRAVREMERAMKELKLNGFILNSHTSNEYLDNPRYFPILEAAEAMDAAIYLHPRCPSAPMQAPFADYNLGGALWGFAVETGTHALRMIMSGVFDRFPRLTIVLGHMGELIPLHLWRLDYMGRSYAERAGLKLKPSEYFKRNFCITTSGVEDDHTLRYCIEQLGADRILWAIDYPYQISESATKWMNEAPISDQDKEKIFHLNAERIFHIAPAA